MENITVRANLHLALGNNYDEKAAQNCLEALDIGETLGEKVQNLSGGMRRRVALARALLYDAPLMVLDEPFKGLDAECRRRVMDIVKRESMRRPVLMVTHDKAETEYLDAAVILLGEQ